MLQGRCTWGLSQAWRTHKWGGNASGRVRHPASRRTRASVDVRPMHLRGHSYPVLCRSPFLPPDPGGWLADPAVGLPSRGCHTGGHARPAVAGMPGRAPSRSVPVAVHPRSHGPAWGQAGRGQGRGWPCRAIARSGRAWRARTGAIVTLSPATWIVPMMISNSVGPIPAPRRRGPLAAPIRISGDRREIRSRLTRFAHPHPAAVTRGSGGLRVRADHRNARPGLRPSPVRGDRRRGRPPTCRTSQRPS